MSSEPSKDTPATPPTEPFTRGKIVWGRPPQPVFQVGPLPRATTPAPQVQTQSRRSAGGGILTGSMIPPARPVAPEQPVEVASPAEPDVVITPLPVEPEPIVAAPEPRPEAVAAPVAQEIVIEPEAAEPAVTVPPLSGAASPAARPRELPSVVVTPTLYATMGAAVQEVAKGGRWTIAAGVAALVIIGGFIWLATLPAPQPIAPAPTPLIAGAAPLEDVAPPVEEASTVEAAPAPVRTTPTPAPAAAVPTPVTAPVVAQPRRAAPIAVTPPVQTAPRPYIETAPLIVDPPTPAEPAPTNPDAPIATRPQPLD